MYTNFHGNRLNGIEVDVLQRHLVVSYNNVDSAKIFLVLIYLCIPIFMAIG